MSEADKTRRDYFRAVVDAYSERRLQAGLLAMSELQSDLYKGITFADFSSWCDRVNKLADQIMQRPN